MTTKLRTPRSDQLFALNALSEAMFGVVNLPTGSGKSLIQVRSIINDIKYRAQHNMVPGVYVILSPRILLSNQLFAEVQQDLLLSEIDCKYLIVHSDLKAGKNADAAWDKAVRANRALKSAVKFSETKATCSPKIVKEEYNKAVSLNLPLIVSGTYDSADRINKYIPVNQLHCDEAHFLVSSTNQGFGWIPESFEATRKYYYTATMKVTKSDFGRGMNNIELFGPVIVYASPAEMVEKGVILKPRLHFVNVEHDDGEDSIVKDVRAITSSFNQHRALLNTGAKMLIVTQGSEHLEDIVSHPEMREYQESKPNLTIFDISSKYEPRVNGVVVSKAVFLAKLQEVGADSSKDAIILHIQILQEGIDVPGITGVMFFKILGLSALLQNIGRATRLHPDDRKNLELGKYGVADLKRWVKPYAWVIIPVFGEIGNDLKAELSELVYALRTYGFKPEEDVFVKVGGGSPIPEPLPGLNQLDTVVRHLSGVVGEIIHEIEAEESITQNQLEIEHNRRITDEFDF
jgi:hypothetical protein